MKLPWQLTAFGIVLALVYHLGAYAFLSFVRYTPRRIMLEARINQWRETHEADAKILDMINETIFSSGYATNPSLH